MVELLTGLASIGVALNVGVAFYLYRLYVEVKTGTIAQKDATIETPTRQLEEAKAKTPEAIEKLLHERVERLQGELLRLRDDEVEARRANEEKQSELARMNEQLTAAKAQIDSVADLIWFMQLGKNVKIGSITSG